jgi:hypothetical protein
LGLRTGLAADLGDQAVTLDEIGLSHGTDKASNGHNYLHFYEQIFPKYATGIHKARVLEIGAQFGLSLRTWRDYFAPHYQIVGIDHIDNPQAHDPSYQIAIGNAYHEAMVMGLEPMYFDIMIDDGSHDADDIRWFLTHYNRLLAPGGIMIVEDCRMSWTTYCVHMALPPGWQWAIVDFTTLSPLPDSTLILAWKP